MTKTLLKRSISSLGLAALAAAPGAQASVSVQNYNTAANSTYTQTEDAMLEIAPYDPTWNGQRLFFSAHYNWLNDALIEYDATRTQRIGTLVDSVSTLDLTAGWFVTRRASINVSVPLNMVHFPNAAQQFGLGDTRAFVKWRLTGDNAMIAVSIIPELRFPTGDPNLFLSDGNLGGGASLAFERDFGPVRAAANIGYRYNGNATYREIDYTNRLPLALGLYAPLGSGWGANLEASGTMVLPRDRYNNPGEIYAGLRYQVSRDAAVLGGVSVGTVSTVAGNDSRFSVGLRFSPMPEEKKPDVVPVVAATAPMPVEEPKSTPRVVFTPKEIKLGEEVKFEHDSDRLTKSGRDLLDEVARVIKQNRKSYLKILIEGHTNELGTYPYNQTLSENRANSVREYLTSRGIKGKELMAIGYGKTKPKRVRGRLSRDAKLAANRRVVFRVIN